MARGFLPPSSASPEPSPSAPSPSAASPSPFSSSCLVSSSSGCSLPMPDVMIFLLISLLMFPFLNVLDSFFIVELRMNFSLSSWFICFSMLTVGPRMAIHFSAPISSILACFSRSRPGISSTGPRLYFKHFSNAGTAPFSHSCLRMLAVTHSIHMVAETTWLRWATPGLRPESSARMIGVEKQTWCIGSTASSHSPCAPSICISYSSWPSSCGSGSPSSSGLYM
mmetsp:Transcript_31375/g.79274  ORF Transcript_31375/g.79274 Transcript_31375/m.79274 type:complete len:224 (+) Transcript_31375:936-1607(+)